MRDHGRPFCSTDQGVRSDPDKPPDGSRTPSSTSPCCSKRRGIVSAPLAESNDGEKTRKRKAPTEEVAEEGKKKRSKKPKDPNAPRRPASSYILYQNHVRKDLRAKFPTLSNAELLSMISKQWAEMTEDEKLYPNASIPLQIYHQATADAKEKFQADKKAYENRSPEEVAAATMAAEEAAAAKKVRKPRAPKAPKAPVQQLAVPAAPKAVVSSSHDEGSDESDEESDEDIPAPPKAVPTKPVQQSDSEEEESDEEDEEDEDDPPAKRQKSTPAPAGKRRNHA
ncbi:HMG-box [Salix suchowensis]|nr:HMG-box [Salix suchowensis]